MAKLNRVTQKIFASNAGDEGTAVLGSMKTGTPEYSIDLSDLMSSDAYLDGWDAAVEEGFAPFLEEMNGLQMTITTQLKYLLDQGIAEYDANTTYYTGASCVVVGTSGNFKWYASVVDENVGNDVTNTTYWMLIYDTENPAVTISGTQTITGNKTFSGTTLLSTTTGVKYSASNSTTVTNLATVGWVNDASYSTNVLHRSGTETATGAKTFSGGLTSSGTTTLSTATGVKYSASASTSVTNLATVGWVNDASYSTNVVHRSGTETISGTKTISSSSGLLLNSSSIPATGDSSYKVPCTSWVGSAIDTAIAANPSAPTGSIIAFAGSTAPEGFLICDGSAVSRTTYAALFAVIGTTYGSGDGNTTFNLPNLVDCLPWKSSATSLGTYSAGQIPNITGTLLCSGITGTESSLFTGAFSRTGNYESKTYGASTGREYYNNMVNFYASRSSSLYTDISIIIPAHISTEYIIKY